MNIYRSIDEIPYQKESHLTIGTFDGIHLGHRKIIEDLVSRAGQKNARSVLVTFYPHPQTVVRARKSPIQLLTPIDEKIALLQTFGLDAVLVIPFTQELSRIEPKTFVEEILVRSIGVREFIIGYNHRFGRGRRGGKDLLEELGPLFDFSVDVVKPVEIEGEGVSSTRIRHLFLEGKIRRGNCFLGRRYSLEGIVRRGSHLGEKIGFPTANLEVIGENKLIPGDGVYAVMVYLDGERLLGMANIGYKPTLDGTHRCIEVHIHDFSGHLYGKTLQVEFVDRIRDERRFGSVEALISQIEHDRRRSVELLSNNV